MPLAAAVIAAAGVGCVPADSNIVGGRDASTGTCSPACAAGQTCVNNVCVGDGLFRTTLTWDRPGDLDLHVVVPGGQTISFRARSAGGGVLDRDDTSGTGPENVFWTTAPPLGEYVVCVIPFAITGATNFTLNTRLPNGGTDTRTGSRAASTPSGSCSRTSPFFVVSYTITGGSTGDAGAGDAATDASAGDGGATEDASVLPDVDLGVDVPSLEDVATD